MYTKLQGYRPLNYTYKQNKQINKQTSYTQLRHIDMHSAAQTSRNVSRNVIELPQTTNNTSHESKHKTYEDICPSRPQLLVSISCSPDISFNLHFVDFFLSHINSSQIAKVYVIFSEEISREP